MFEAYAIGVTLKLNNLISPQLALIAQEIEKLSKITGIYQSTLARLGMEAKGIKAIGAAANSTNAAFERATVSATALERRIAAIKAAGSLPAPMSPALGGGGGRGGGGGHRNGMHGGNIHMGPGGIGLGTMGLAAGDAFVPLAVTAGMVWAGHSLYTSAKDLNTEMSKFKLFGLSDKLNTEAFKFVEGMKVYGTSRAENMKNFREAQGVFRESGLNDSSALDGAKLAAPILAKIAFLTESLDDESKARMRTSSMSMLRYVESSGGLKSAAEFNRIADFGYKMMMSSGGAVNWEQLRQFKARAGASGFHLTDDALARLEPVIAEMKGGAVGFGLSTSFNRLTGAVRVPNQVAHELVQSGIWDASKVVFNKQGGIKNFTGNPLKDSDLLLSNPALFYEKVIQPMYQKMHLSPTDIARQNIMLFGTTGGRNMTLLENQMPAIHRSVDALAKAKGIDDSMDVGKESLSGQEREFTEAWTDFKTVLGTVLLPEFTKILQNGAVMIRGISAFMTDNAATIKTLANVAGFVYNHTPVAGPVVGALSGAQTLYDLVRPGSKNKGAGQANVYMDGRKVGEIVSGHQSRDMARPATGGRLFDPSVSVRMIQGAG